MKVSTPAAKPAQKARWEAMREYGCICCRLNGFFTRDVEIHHMNEGGTAGSKRRGHDFTVALCPWHHKGVVSSGMTSIAAAKLLGPSLAKQSKVFRERYGTDDELLEKQNYLLEHGASQFTQKYMQGAIRYGF